MPTELPPRRPADPRPQPTKHLLAEMLLILAIALVIAIAAGNLR
jgi:hypothetical protein